MGHTPRLFVSLLYDTICEPAVFHRLSHSWTPEQRLGLPGLPAGESEFFRRDRTLGQQSPRVRHGNRPCRRPICLLKPFSRASRSGRVGRGGVGIQITNEIFYWIGLWMEGLDARGDGLAGLLCRLGRIPGASSEGD